jgi:hypothetical protein
MGIGAVDSQPRVDDAGVTEDATSGDDGGCRAGTRTTWLGVGLLFLVGGVPLAVGLIALRDPRWYPSLDYAMIELRVRDVATSDTPMVGLAGRIHGYGQQGSHPGPVSFWVLWPAYKLFGSSGWALQVSAAAVNLVAFGAALWIAVRRGGRGVLLGAAGALSLLMLGYGIDRLTEPWNPYMPMLWWVVFLLAVWSVVCDDLVLLPVAVFAGSFCAQTHIPYVGLVGGMLVFVAVVLGVRAWRADIWRRRCLAGWSAASLGVLGAIWLPPVIDEVRRSPGNLAILRENFTHPSEAPIGLGGRAVEAWLAHLDLWQLPRHGWSFDEAPLGSPVSGLVLLCAWFAAAVITWRRRHAAPSIWQLHVVVAVALVLGLVSVTRIFGPLLSYLLLWAWGTTVLVVVATVWSAASAWSAGPAGRRPPRWAAGAGAVVLLTVVLGSTAGLTVTAARAPGPYPDESRVLANLVPDTVDALRDGRARGAGLGGRYLVQWSDASKLGSEGYGLLLELERAGLDVGGQASWATNLVPHRTRRPDGATATVTFVRGDDDIESWRSNPDAVEVAYFDPRTSGELARYHELGVEVDAGLRDAGLDAVADLMGENVLLAALDERFPSELRPEIVEMLELGESAAVFIGPPDLVAHLIGSSTDGPNDGEP